MDNIQLASTVVAQTGTGNLFTAFSSGPDSASFTNGVGTTRMLLTYKRTLPKPVKGFSGMERGEIVLTRYVTENDVEYPISVRIVTSIPVVTDDTAREAVYKDLLMLVHQASVHDLVDAARIPL